MSSSTENVKLTESEVFTIPLKIHSHYSQNTLSSLYAPPEIGLQNWTYAISYVFRRTSPPHSFSNETSNRKKYRDGAPVQKEIGDWAVSSVSTQGLEMIDSFPYCDLGLIKALTRGEKVSTKKNYSPQSSNGHHTELMPPFVSGTKAGRNKSMIFYTTFETPFCKITLAGTKDGICGLHLDTGEGKRAFAIGDDWIRNEAVFADAKEKIEAYFAGNLQSFAVALQLHGTDFQKKVWTALLDIPFGEVRTYGEVAAAIGNKKASRAVGMANSKNPIPLIIPCHRVIGADGSLTGFAHGLSIKRKLLEFERQHR